MDPWLTRDYRSYWRLPEPPPSPMRWGTILLLAAIGLELAAAVRLVLFEQ